jgi:hypothetical protein
VTTQGVIVLVVALALMAASWVVVFLRRRKPSAPPAPVVPSPQPILDAALGPIHDRLADDLGKLEDAAESPTPATDVATIARARVRRPE